MKNIIHIYGASGSGTSTLGKALSEKLGYKFMDTDDYFWLPTDPKFTVKRKIFERISMMRADMESSSGAVISGSLVDWGDVLIPDFTLVIRLVTDRETRITRIKKREFERFGDRILPDGDMFDQHRAFLKWAWDYDDGSVDMRSKRKHDEWQKKLLCRQIVLDGAAPVEDNINLVLKELG